MHVWLNFALLVHNVPGNIVGRMLLAGRRQGMLGKNIGNARATSPRETTKVDKTKTTRFRR